MACEILTRRTDDEGRPTDATRAELARESGISRAFTRGGVLQRSSHIDYQLRRIDHRSASGTVQERFSPWNPFYALFPLRALGRGRDPPFAGLQAGMTAFHARRRCCGLFLCFPDDNVHLITSYASLCGIGLFRTEDAYALFDRQTVYRELLACKLPNGAFATSVGMEHDVRSTFSAILIACVVDSVTPAIAEGVADTSEK
jgi:protein farnesyltransferase subunit beta